MYRIVINLLATQFNSVKRAIHLQKNMHFVLLEDKFIYVTHEIVINPFVMQSGVGLCENHWNTAVISIVHSAMPLEERLNNFLLNKRVYPLC